MATKSPKSLKCSACSGTLKPGTPLRDPTGSLVCTRCGGLHGSCYRGEATNIVGLGLPMLAEASSPEALRYFDLTVLGSDGIAHVHGWYDSTKRRVVQIG